MSRPAHLRAAYLGLAVIGGTVGTAAREGISLAVPEFDGIPAAIFGINLLGAFLLGLLLESLARRGPDVGVRRTLRILVGTGFMGGFTTYSALATDAASLLGEGRAGIGIGYGLATVLLGGLTTWAGIALGTLRRGGPHEGEVPVDPDLAEAADPTAAPDRTIAPEVTGNDGAADAFEDGGGR